MGARPSNDGVMRTYETTSLVMLRPWWAPSTTVVRFRFRAEVLRGGYAPYQYQRDDSEARQHDGNGQGEPGATPGVW
jgi:hypothetical protein